MAKELSRSYGKLQAVERLSFEIGPGEVIGLLGHNGAGKTTLMRMLSGALAPSSGSIEFNGAPLAGNRLSLSQQLGYLPENLPLYPELTAVEYLDYVASCKGLRRKAKLDAIAQSLEATQLSTLALRRSGSLSRGQKQRLGVAQALLGAPKLLILDEPGNGLDPTQTQHMRALIRSLSGTTTVIISTHIMAEVEAVCDRALILQQGQLMLDESIATLRHSRQLLLRCSGDSALLGSGLRHLPQLVAVQAQPCQGRQLRFLLTLHRTADADTAANNIANCVLQAGAKLYQLQLQQRSLESVFRDLTSSSTHSVDTAMATR